MNVHVVIAHYHENLEWTTNLKYPYEIISKGEYPKESVPNKGNEASSYLRYIIDHYENLPQIMIFVHGHRSDWHHRQNIDEKINSMSFDSNYRNINDYGTRMLTDFQDSFYKMMTLMPNIERILGKSIDLRRLRYKFSAQFYVKRELVLSNSKTVYIKLHQYLMDSTESSYWTGRIFEYIWHFIFTGQIEDS